MHGDNWPLVGIVVVAFVMWLVGMYWIYRITKDIEDQ